MAVSVSMSGDAEVSVRVEVTAPPVPTTGELKAQASPVGRPEGQLRASADGERTAEPLGVIVTVTAPVPDGDRVSAEGLIVVVNGLECPASFVPVELIQTGNKGAEYGTREEA